MGINWSLYENRLNIDGKTQTERNINRIKNNIVDKMDGNPSYKSVIINLNTTSQTLLINDTTDDYKKKILSLPNETFKSGDTILWNSNYWIVIKSDCDNTIQTKGTMQKCNWILKWQKSDGTILSYPCIDESKSTSGGEDENKTITLGDTEHLLTLPYDENTVLLRTPQRFFLDKHPTKPTPYKTVQNNNTSYEGLVKIVVNQDVLKETTVDRVDLGICDYFSPTTPPNQSDISSYSVVACSGNVTKISIGSSRTITATMYDSKDVVNSTVTPVFTYTYPVGFEDQFTVSVVDAHRIKIAVKDNVSLLKKSVKVGVSDGQGGYVGELVLTITAGM